MRKLSQIMTTKEFIEMDERGEWYGVLKLGAFRTKEEAENGVVAMHHAVVESLSTIGVEPTKTGEVISLIDRDNE